MTLTSERDLGTPPADRRRQPDTAAVDVTIDGKTVKGDKNRAGGVHANAAMWVDPHLKNTCMIDKVGGSVSFYDTRIKLIKM